MSKGTFIARLGIVITLFVVPFLVYALNTVDTGFRVGASVVEIDAHGICKLVNANDGREYFVPTRSANEWTTFIANHPSGIDLQECVAVPPPPPPVLDSDVVTTSGSGLPFMRLNGQDATERWSKADSYYSLAIDNNSQHIYVSWGEVLKKLDFDGNVIWQNSIHFYNSPPESQIMQVKVGDDGYVYTATRNEERVRKIDPATGNEIWRYDGHRALFENFIYSLSVDSDGNVYSGDRRGAVHKINSSGAVEWVFYGHPSWVMSTYPDDAGHVYTSGFTTDLSFLPGVTFKLDANTGTPIWSKNFGGYALDIDSNGDIFVFGEYIRKVRPATGSIVWEHENTTAIVGFFYHGTVDDAGNAYAVDISGILTKLDPDGALIYEAPMKGMWRVEVIDMPTS